MSLNSPDALDAAARAERDGLRALVHAAAGNLRVLQVQRARDVRDRHVVGAEPIRVERDVDLAAARPQRADGHGRRARALDLQNAEIPAAAWTRVQSVAHTRGRVQSVGSSTTSS